MQVQLLIDAADDYTVHNSVPRLSSAEVGCHTETMCDFVVKGKPVVASLDPETTQAFVFAKNTFQCDLNISASDADKVELGNGTRTSIEGRTFAKLSTDDSQSDALHSFSLFQVSIGWPFSSPRRTPSILWPPAIYP